MPVYAFRGIGWDGDVVKGYMVGASPQQIRQGLHGKNIDLLSVRRVWRKTPSQREKSRFFLHLCHALQAGHPLVQALDTVAHSCGKSFLPVVYSVRDHVAQGHVLSQALSLHPDVFSGLIRARIVVGEETGHLIGACHDVHSFLDVQHQRHQQWTQTLVYPALNAVCLMGVLIMLSHTLLPQILDLTRETGHSQTMTLWVLQALFHQIWGLLLLGLVAMTVMAAWRWPQGMPWLRTWVAHQQYSSFFAGVHLLLKAHMPLYQALSIMVNSSSSKPMVACMTHTLDALTQGKSLHHAVKHWPHFDAIYRSYIQVGEQTGQWVASLDVLVRCLDETMQQRRQRLMTWSTPCLLALMGVVLWMVFDGAMLPLYDVWVGHG